MNLYNLPEMTDTEWKKAPWNQEDPKVRKIQVTVSLTLSKTLEVNVNDADNYNLKDVVREQIVLPSEAYKLHWFNCFSNPVVQDILEDLKGWNEDDFEVIEE